MAQRLHKIEPAKRKQIVESSISVCPCSEKVDRVHPVPRRLHGRALGRVGERLEVCPALKVVRHLEESLVSKAGKKGCFDHERYGISHNGTWSNENGRIGPDTRWQWRRLNTLGWRGAAGE